MKHPLFLRRTITGKILTADSNYHTQVNLRKCQELGELYQ